MNDIKVAPSRDFAAINRLVNHPDVLPHIIDDSMEAHFDASLLNQRDNIFLKATKGDVDMGFMAFINRGYGIYELHSGFLPEYRGISAIKAGKKGFEWLFLSTNAETISTWAWEDAKNVIWAAHVTGFRDIGDLDWPHTVKGKKQRRRVFIQTLQDWAMAENRKFEPIGNRVVAEIPKEMRGYMGIALIMGLNGHQLKAQEFWNRHCAILGGKPIQVFAPRAGSMVFSMDNTVFEANRDLSIFKIEQLK